MVKEIWIFGAVRREREEAAFDHGRSFGIVIIMKGFINEFKAFAMRGNVIDLAVGVIIGGAFGKIVSSLVDNVFSPIIAAVTSGKQFQDSFKIPLSAGAEAATINVGAFLQSTIDFVIIAFCVFIIVKMVNRAVDILDGDEPATKAKKVPEDIQLLREIRDALKKGG